MIFTKKEVALINGLLDKYMLIDETKNISIDLLTREFNKEEIVVMREKILLQIQNIKKDFESWDKEFDDFSETAIIIYKDIYEKLSLLKK